MTLYHRCVHFQVIKELSYKNIFSCKNLAVKMDNLLIDLNEFEKSLNHAESLLIAKVNSVSSIVDILVDLDLCICTDNIASLVPKSVLACHYVYFRMTLRR